MSPERCSGGLASRARYALLPTVGDLLPREALPGPPEAAATTLAFPETPLVPNSTVVLPP